MTWWLICLDSFLVEHRWYSCHLRKRGKDLLVVAFRPSYLDYWFVNFFFSLLKKKLKKLILILQISYAMCQYHYFVCPIEYSESLGRMTMECEPSYLFKLQEYTLPQFLQVVPNMVINRKLLRIFFFFFLTFKIKNYFFSSRWNRLSLCIHLCCIPYLCPCLVR